MTKAEFLTTSKACKAIFWPPRGLRRTLSKDTSWSENTEIMQIFPFTTFTWCLHPYLWWYQYLWLLYHINWLHQYLGWLHPYLCLLYQYLCSKVVLICFCFEFGVPQHAAMLIHSSSTMKSRKRFHSWCNTLFCHTCWPCSWCHKMQSVKHKMAVLTFFTFELPEQKSVSK